MRRPWAVRSSVLSHHADLPSPPEFSRLVAVSLGPSGEAVAVWSDLPRSPRGAVTIVTPDATTTLEFENFIPAETFVQPLPDGRALLVNRGSDWHPSRPDENAVVLNEDGVVEHSRHVGFGVAHVRTTRDGDIWIGYDDIGVYDDGIDGSHASVGATGLVRFSRDLTVDWEYSAEQAGWSIDDCYALTLADGEIWLCPYFGFPIVRIKSGQEFDSWAAPSRSSAPVGAHALAVHDRQVALLGGLEARNGSRVVLADLERGAWVPRKIARLVLPDGQPIDAGMRSLGWNDEFHVFRKNRWYRTDMEKIKAC